MPYTELAPRNSRRTFLREGSAAVLAAATGMSVKHPAAVVASWTPIKSQVSKKKCVFLFLHGGPSQLETFDPKPNAPSPIRGPFGTIATVVPGMHLSENLPCLAKLADRFAIARSLTWDGPAVHAAGVEILHTGQSGSLTTAFTLAEQVDHHWSARSQSAGTLSAVTLGGSLHDTAEMQSQIAATKRPNAAKVVSAITSHSFIEDCRSAVQFINAGVPFVTVNMFPKLMGTLSWDCHANGGDLPTTLLDYKNIICPQFDAGCAILLEGLEQSGQLDETLVVATGEFGRAPRVNTRGGREHWTGVWSALIAGAGIRGGAVLGASDATGAEPLSRPICPKELFRVMQQHLGISPVPADFQPGSAIQTVEPPSPLTELFT